MSGSDREPDLSGAAFAVHVAAIAERRDRASFVVLFDHYAPRIKSYLKRLGAGDSLAEDIAQEVMLNVWRKADQYDPMKASVGTWIFTIARNQRIDTLRRERHPELDPTDPMLSPAATPEPDGLVTRAQDDARVRAALRELPPEQAEIIGLSFFADQSHGDIAARLGLPLGTVKSRMRLAFRRIRERLGDTP